MHNFRFLPKYVMFNFNLISRNYIIIDSGTNQMEGFFIVMKGYLLPRLRDVFKIDGVTIYTPIDSIQYNMEFH